MITNAHGKAVDFEQTIEYITKNSLLYPFLSRTASYAKGAALGCILDKLDPELKHKIEDSKNNNGSTQFEILKTQYSD
ncbi:hypothetical protein MTQ00_21860 [Chryseobacterium sp. B21-037]|uniref:hypothetical protein n=1 Tax=Chryseobacterium sp. B21-037 TaxID=2926038 RepID=UPI00235886F5|nr:hypothetical protein [Chryseobacterium sp. B21-037]MDC8107136.1 hypothetical protein [Chryseobacterium sp. B21-037]WBV56331.1 hypothetical protein PFY10_19265 [Chryseobacterium daecheongense]